MYKTYIMKLSAPDIVQVKMCTKDCYMQFFGDIFEYPDHMLPIDDERPMATDKVKMFTIKKDGHVYSIFKMWGDEHDMAIFEAEIQHRSRDIEQLELEIQDMA